jgi:hypothetical protein
MNTMIESETIFDTKGWLIEERKKNEHEDRRGKIYCYSWGLGEGQLSLEIPIDVRGVEIKLGRKCKGRGCGSPVRMVWGMQSSWVMMR